MVERKSKTICITVYLDQLERMDALAKTLAMTRSGVIRLAVKSLDTLAASNLIGNNSLGASNG